MPNWQAWGSLTFAGGAGLRTSGASFAQAPGARYLAFWAAESSEPAPGAGGLRQMRPPCAGNPPHDFSIRFVFAGRLSAGWGAS